MTSSQYEQAMVARLRGIDPTDPISHDMLVTIGDATRLLLPIPAALQSALVGVQDDAIVPLVQDALARLAEAKEKLSADELVGFVDELGSFEAALLRIGAARRRLPERALLEPIQACLRAARTNVAARLSLAAAEEALGARVVLRSKGDWLDQQTWLDTLPRIGTPDRELPTTSVIADYAARGDHAVWVESEAARDAEFAEELSETLDLLASTREPLGLAARRWRKRMAAPQDGSEVVELEWAIPLSLAAADDDDDDEPWTDLTIGRIAPIDAHARIAIDSGWATLFVFPVEDGAPITRVRFGGEVVLKADARGIWRARAALGEAPLVMRVDDARGETFAVSLRPVPTSEDLG